MGPLEEPRQVKQRLREVVEDGMALHVEEGVIHFDLADDDDDADAETPWTDVSNLTRPSSELAQKVRDKMAYLNPQDQKVVCQRECVLASRYEESLLNNMRQVVDKYKGAIELAKALNERPEDMSQTIDPELLAKYQERVTLIESTMETLQAEAKVQFPKLTGLDAVKGTVFATYANTAQAAKQFGDRAGATTHIIRAAQDTKEVLVNVGRLVRSVSQELMDGDATGAAAHTMGNGGFPGTASAPGA